MFWGVCQKVKKHLLIIDSAGQGICLRALCSEKKCLKLSSYDGDHERSNLLSSLTYLYLDSPPISQLERDEDWFVGVTQLWASQPPLSFDICFLF